MVSLLVQEKPDVVLVTGDLVEGRGSNMATRLQEWRRIMAPLYNAGVTILPVRGNHEDEGSVGAFQATFPDLPQNGPAKEKGLTYYLNHKNALFVGLDQYVHSHRINQPWLDQVLAGNHQTHVFVFSHESAFAAEHQWTMRLHAGDRDRFWNSLGAAGVRMYICGHDHLYARAAIGDSYGRRIEQIIVGSGGAPFHQFSHYKDKRVQAEFQATSQYGYLIVDVDGQKVTAQWKAQGWTRGGQTFAAADHFGYAAAAPTPIAAAVR